MADLLRLRIARRGRRCCAGVAWTRCGLPQQVECTLSFPSCGLMIGANHTYPRFHGGWAGLAGDYFVAICAIVF